MAVVPHVLPIQYGSVLADFASVASEPQSVLLHSAGQSLNQGRYSFWASKPLTTFESRDGFVTFAGHTQIDTPHEALKRVYEKVQDLPFDPYLPFSGGLIGYFGYEWGAQLENVATAVARGVDLPDCWLGLYDTIVTYDHIEKRAWIVAPTEEVAETLAEELYQHRRYQRNNIFDGSTPQTNEYISNFNREKYLQAVRQVQRYLKAGDCYQVNLSQQFAAPARETPWEIYQRLAALSPAPYGAYLHAGPYTILSSSPECLLEAKPDGTLITRPIKGTRARGATPEADETLKQELLSSAKDHAELLMITDLERNDLGKVCAPGTVKTLKLTQLESYAQVHHLVSTIEGKRLPEKDIVDCLTALLPGGSITGAPKIRAMQIIHELESVRRDVYTGAIGWIGPQQTAHLNIAIRTITVQNANAYFSAGGGIVIDSDPESEYAETFAKAKGMMEALGLSQ